MKKLMKLATSEDLKIICHTPFSEEDIKQRNIEYFTLPYDKFKKKYRHHVFTPSTIDINDIHYKLQFNKCYNPFCKWYGLPQKRYDEIKSKPSRYKLGQSGLKGSVEPRISCNSLLDTSIPGESLGNTSEVVSNWSVGEEIKRLITINSVTPVEKDYVFHRDGCSNNVTNPFQNKEVFYKRGKSTSNSTKYQCKECKKITNILPSKEESFSYHQSRNEVLIPLIKDLLSRTPVKRTCEKLDIASGTYYNKLEWIYRKCLEFLERRETEQLSNKNFDEIWLNTDMMIYNLNNIKVKGKGKAINIGIKEKKLQTYLLASGDLKSGYVFRSDIAYDFTTSLDDIERDTKENFCDHSYSFLRKNDRLKYSYAPQPPTQFDVQMNTEYEDELELFENRKSYVEGSHVKSKYTSLAHYWLIKKMINSSKWYFVSDDDATLEASIFRIFSANIEDKQSHYFTCQVDKSFTLEESGKIFFKNRMDLIKWSRDNDYNGMSIIDIAQKKLELDLSTHEFYEYKNINGINYPSRGSNPIKSPLSDKDEGDRIINCITDISGISIGELAELLVQVNSRTINNYFQQIRRRVSILERPLVTARGDGKSYIYANYNPKYAQHVITIFRTVYNFCWATKSNGELQTPAQRLGLTDKIFDYKDIIYFR